MQKGIIKLFIFIAFLFMSGPCEASDTDLERDLQDKLRQSRALLEKAGEKLKSGNSAGGEISKLILLSEDIRATHLFLQERFRLMEEEVRARGSKAGERHRVMEEGYMKALSEYLNLIESLRQYVGAYDNTPGLIKIIETLKTLLDSVLPKRQRPIIGSLPYRHLNYPPKEPLSGPSITPAYKGGNKTVNPEDTKDTEEAPLSLEMAELAQSLRWNPVSIYEYVKNNIETQWYWGCMKGAEETLRQKSGNDCDQATLFAALLRVSGFPTRYVRGTIEFFAGGRDIDIDKVKNLTGIDDPLKIGEFFQKAGIPYRPVIKGGGIANFQIEHIWVETEVPYGNYRGAIIDDSDPTWLGLDTSIKITEYTYNAPLDIFGQPALVDQLSILRDEYLSAPQTLTPLEYLKEKLSSVSAQPLEDYKETRALIPDILNILPASMQFNQVSITHEYIEIPDELKHKVRFVGIHESPMLDITIDAMELSNRKTVISYEPETVEDQQIIDSYGGLNKTPAYLVRLRPVLKVDGERMVVGKDGLPMGESYDLTIELISPNATERIKNTQITGNVVAIGIVGGKVTPLPQGGDTATPSPLGGEGGGEGQDKDAEGLLYEEAMHYIDRWNKTEDELASLLHLAMSRPVPTVAMVGGVIDVTYLLDMPHGFEWKGVFVDASMRAINLVGANGGSVTPSGSPLAQEGEKYRQRIFMQLSALEGSVLEHRIFEDDWQVDAISTANLFQIVGAMHASPLQVIDKTTIVAILPILDLDDNIKEDITNAVNQNLVVRIPSREITYKDWTGIGYTKENPATAEDGYMLSGMLVSSSPDLSGIAGGMTAVSPGRWRSQNLRLLLAHPFTPRSENKEIAPLGIAILFPFDGTMVASSSIDVEGLVSDPVSTVEVNGIKATVSQDGIFIAKGISLTEGTNYITASGKDPIGQEAAYTITIERAMQNVPPLMVSIISPKDGDVISRPQTMVKGTIATDAKEVSIKVNGVLAEVYGNQFVADGVPLTEGDNAIVVYASDSNGAIGRAEVRVKAITTGPYIRLNANITSGIPALTTYFVVTTELPNPVMTYEMDFEGDGVIDYTGASFEEVSFVYTSEGIYYPILKVTDDQGNTYSDTIPVVVLNKQKLDALLKEKWEGMKAALGSGDIEGALKYFSPNQKQMFGYNFKLMAQYLGQIIEEMGVIQLVSAQSQFAEYEMTAVQEGTVASFYVAFVKDSSGIWRIYFF